MIKAFLRLFTGSLFGKGTGVVREILLAASFGTGPAAGAYRAAQTATLIPTNLFASETLNAGFIPLCARYVKEGKDRVSSLYWGVLFWLLGLSIFTTLVLYFGADLWISILVPGFAGESRDLAIQMVRVLAWGVPFYTHATLCSYLEIAHGAYTAASIRSALQNAGMILGILLAVLLKDPDMLAWGFTGYSMVFSAICARAVHRAGYLEWPSSLRLREARGVVSEFLRVVRPLMLIPLLSQAVIIVERVFASRFGFDVLASVDYAKTIAETGVVLVAVPLGFASLAELGVRSDGEARDVLRRVVPALLLLMIPCSAFLVAHSETVIRVVYARGSFDEEAVFLTAPILAALALGFWAQVAGFVLLKSLSARGQNRKVAGAVALSRTTNVVAIILLTGVFGPAAFGAAISLSGLALCATGAIFFGLGRDLLAILAPLILSAAGYVVLGSFLPGGGLLALLCAMLVSFIYWVAAVTVVPEMRRVALDILGTFQRGIRARKPRLAG